jgi:phosphohistidine phosphatase
MKVFLLLRHGKSSWESAGLSDHDRPLNNRGKRDAPRMGKVLLEEGIVPEIIISSSAIRARSTAERVAKSSRYDGQVIIQSSLYRGGPEAYLDVLRRQPDRNQTVLMVGHNPDIEQLLEMLTRKETIMPTCSLAVVNLPVKRWLDLTKSTKAELRKVWRPKELSHE